MDINLDFILRLSIYKRKHPRGPASIMCVCDKPLYVRSRCSQRGQMEVGVCDEGLISSVNHLRWVSRRGRDRNCPLNKEIKS